MLVSVEKLREILKGLDPKIVLDFSDEQITIFAGTETPRIRKVNRQEVFRLVEEGWTYEKIGQHLGVTRAAIGQIIARKVK